jgi:hypothetical protein
MKKKAKDTEVSVAVVSEPTPAFELKADPERINRRPVTNILVRATVFDGAKSNVDITHLDRRSLLHWLSEDPERSLKVLLLLMGHPLEV